MVSLQPRLCARRESVTSIQWSICEKSTKGINELQRPQRGEKTNAINQMLFTISKEENDILREPFRTDKVLQQGKTDRDAGVLSVRRTSVSIMGYKNNGFLQNAPLHPSDNMDTKCMRQMEKLHTFPSARGEARKMPYTLVRD